MSSEPAQPERRLPSGADEGVIIGYPVSRGAGSPLVLGTGARLRSGTVLYDGTTIGQGLQTGHGVVVREGCVIGDDVSIWSNSVVDYSCRIGHRVKIHCNCYVAQYTELEDDVFLAPGVTIANDLYPGDERSAEVMAGPKIGFSRTNPAITDRYVKREPPDYLAAFSGGAGSNGSRFGSPRAPRTSSSSNSTARA